MPQTLSNSLPLGPPQFGLRALLIVVSSAAVLLGLSQWLSPITVAALAFLLLSIIAHVAGNVIGSRLRDGRRGQTAAAEQHEHIGDLHDHHYAPVTGLGRRNSLGWTPVLSAVGGMVLGGALGACWTAWLLARNFDWFPVAIAAGAFGALGGLGGFLAVGFCKALGDAWWEAAQPAPENEGD